MCLCVCVSLKADYADLDFSVSHWGRENYRKLIALKKRSRVIRVNEWLLDILFVHIFFLCTYSLSIDRCSGFTVMYARVPVLMYVCVFRYDPNGLFYGHHAVGSELWDASGNCRID